MKSANENANNVPVIIEEMDIGKLIYTIRNKQVMMDYDLASLYGYKVKTLNQQVKRNIARFPEDFMFQLTQDEVVAVKLQIVTSPNSSFFAGQEGGRRKPPLAFTEQGIYMLATILKGEIAERQSVFIMRAFREMRHYIQQNQQFVTKSEWKILRETIEEDSRKLSARQDEADSKIMIINNNIQKINENFLLGTELKNFVIYKGQKLESDMAYIDIYMRAKRSIFVIDDYVNIKTLHLLSHKNIGVHVILFTENGLGRSKNFLTASEIADFNKEYPTIQVKPNPDCHDRFIVLDYGTKEEKVFHCGASSKDSGNKVCAINVIESTDLIHPVIDKLLLSPDKEI